MLTAIGLALIATTAALDGPPVLVVEGKVAQYAQAAEGVRRELPSNALVLDPEDPWLARDVGAASLVIAVGRQALEAVRPLTQGPIVFCMVLGVTPAELARNVTGVPMAPDPKQVFERLKALVPAAKRVGYIHGARGNDLLSERAARAATELGLSLVEHSVVDGAEAKSAFDRMIGSIDAVYLPPDPKVFSQELLHYLLTAAAEHKLPMIGFLDSIAQAGALASVSPNYTEIGVRAGKLGNDILKRPEGKRVPVPAPVFAAGQVSLNLKTAHVLGLEITDAQKAAAGQVYQ